MLLRGIIGNTIKSWGKDRRQLAENQLGLDSERLHEI